MGSAVVFNDLRSIIVPTQLKNCHTGKFLKIENDPDTLDQAFILSAHEQKKLLKELGITADDCQLLACDFAKANGTKCEIGVSSLNQVPGNVMKYWLRPGGYLNFEDYLKQRHGLSADLLRHTPDAGLAPCMTIDVEKLAELSQKINGLGKIGAVRGAQGKVAYYTIQIGCWPKTIAQHSQEMERLYRIEPNRFIKTGKGFSDIEYQYVAPKFEWENPYYRYNVTDYQNMEYSFQGKYYVRAKNHTEFDHDGGFRNREQSDYVWLEEKPLQLILSKADYKIYMEALKHKGNGKAKTITVWAGEVLRSGIPFHALPSYRKGKDTDEKGKQYQDSMIRDYLNGTGQFRECNFLTEALVVPAGFYRTYEFERIVNGPRPSDHLVVENDTKKLSELNREMICREIQLKTGIDTKKFRDDLFTVMNAIDEIQKNDNNESEMTR